MTLPEGIERVSKGPKETPNTADFKTDDAGTVSTSFTSDGDRYSTFTSGTEDTGVKNPYNRHTHLPCEFGNPNGAHSDNGAATHLIYLNGGPSHDPLETPMAACAHHEVEMREKVAVKNPEIQPLFRPIRNQRMVAEHRQRKDLINKDLTLSMEAMMRQGGLKAENGELTTPIKPGTPEALFGRSTESFYTRGAIPTENRALDSLRQRRSEPVDATALEGILARAREKDGAGRTANLPEGFEQPIKDTSPFRYTFKRGKKAIPDVTDSERNLAIEHASPKRKVAHVLRLHKSGVPLASAMLEAHRLGVHSEVESLMQTHMQDFTTSSDSEGNVTITPGKRPQRSRGTIGIGTQGKLAEKLPAHKVETDLATGELRPLSPIESYTADQVDENTSEDDIAARQEEAAIRLREIQARREQLAGRRGRRPSGTPSLKKELEDGTGK